MYARRVVFASAVIAVALTSTGGYAQFGKLKDLAKDKLGVPDKKKSPDPSAQPPDTSSQPSNTSTPNTTATGGATSSATTPHRTQSEFGEVKAVHKSGQEASAFDVRRKNGPTPEVKLAGGSSQKPIAAGGKRDVVMNISNMDANAIDSLRGRKPCDKLSDFVIDSATQVHFSVDLPPEESTGNCDFRFHGADGKYLLAASVQYEGTRQARDREKQEAAMREAHMPMDQQKEIARKRLGKTWSVSFPDGKTEKWTYVSAEPDSYNQFHFKTSSGKKLEVMHMAGGSVVIQMGEDCNMTGQIEGTSANGLTMGEGCGVPMASKWTAQIE